MSDILDTIREKLAAHPDLADTVAPVLEQVRREYGGDTVYIRLPRIRDLSPGSVREIAVRNHVSTRTVQRWTRRPPVPAR